MKAINNIKEWFNFKYNVIVGNIDVKGKPLKCLKCNSSKFIKSDKVFTDYMLCEYRYECDKCQYKVGYWSYGYWEN